MRWDEWDNYPEPTDPPWYVGVFGITLATIIGVCVWLFGLQIFGGTETVEMESAAIDISEVRDIRVEPVEAFGTEWTADNFRKAGVLYHDNVRYTWYSGGILPELDSNERTVSAEGYVIDKDGYIVCASNDYPIGTELWTPLGNVKVYNTERESRTIDIYTSW